MIKRYSLPQWEKRIRRRLAPADSRRLESARRASPPLYVGLLEPYLRGDNWLGVALSALMRVPRPLIAAYGAEAYRRLGTAPLSPQKRFLLGDCVDAYLQAKEGSERDEFWRIVEETSTEGVRAMHKTRVEVAEENARRTARLELLEAIIVGRFGSLSEESLTKLRAMADAELQNLSQNILTASGLGDLGL